jgi:hypothetical protein
VVLEPGDSVFYDGQTSHAVRNDGAEEAVVFYSALRAADQPGITFVEATPAPAAGRPDVLRADLAIDRWNLVGSIDGRSWSESCDESARIDHVSTHEPSIHHR